MRTTVTLAALVWILGAGLAVSQTAKSKAPAAKAKVAQKPAAKKTAAKKTAAKKTVAKRKRPVRRRAVSWRAGQQKPTPERYKQIQEALIAKGYLQGPATGVWKPESVDALKRFQQDQKLEPTGELDALSLIRLDLGPKREAASTDGGLRLSNAKVAP